MIDGYLFATGGIHGSKVRCHDFADGSGIGQILLEPLDGGVVESVSNHHGDFSGQNAAARPPHHPECCIFINLVDDAVVAKTQPSRSCFRIRRINAQSRGNAQGQLQIHVGEVVDHPLTNLRYFDLGELEAKSGHDMVFFNSALAIPEQGSL